MSQRSCDRPFGFLSFYLHWWPFRSPTGEEEGKNERTSEEVVLHGRWRSVYHVRESGEREICSIIGIWEKKDFQQWYSIISWDRIVSQHAVWLIKWNGEWCLVWSFLLKTLLGLYNRFQYANQIHSEKVFCIFPNVAVIKEEWWNKVWGMFAISPLEKAKF